jgi:hypothetical protein
VPHQDSRGLLLAGEEGPAISTRSSTFEEKFVSEKSPSLSPRPVKSNRRTAIPCCVRARLRWPAAFRFLVQVKQWAKSA